MRTAAGFRWLSGAVVLIMIAGSGCARSRSSSQSSVTLRSPGAPTSRGASPETIAGIAVLAPDAFYDPPTAVPHQPGTLLRSEPLKHGALPAGMRGWRILYTTTVNDTTPAIVVATVFSPIILPSGPRPVIAWEHGTTGLLQKCMPSLMSSPTLTIPMLDKVIAQAWVIVATDYSFSEEGGPHPYLIGEGEARAALDSVRAAHQMSELDRDERTVVAGHSQGGHAALWAGIVGPEYAPNVKIVGVAAIAPAANITKILQLNQRVEKRIRPYIALSYSRFYPDVKFE